MPRNEHRLRAEIATEGSRALRPWQAALAGSLVLAGLTFLVYLPSVHGQFMLDDDRYVTDNELVAAPDGLPRMWFTHGLIDYWPMTYTTFWVEWRLWRMNSAGYHVVNLILHIATCLLLWRILQNLSVPGSFLGALLYAVHPVNVETVAWISQLKELLASLFLMLSVLCYLRNEDSSKIVAGTERGKYRPLGGWYWLSLFMFAMAMFSKSSVAFWPLVLLLIAWWRNNRIEARDVWRVLPFFLIAVLLALVEIWFQAHGGDPKPHVNFIVRLAGSGAIVCFYLCKAFVPLNLVFIYPLWHIQIGNLLWWLPLVGILVATAVLWWNRHRWEVRAILFAWFYFCIALSLVAGIFEIGSMKFTLVLDHYLHSALIGVVALVAAGWSYWRAHTQGLVRTAATFCAGVLVVVLSILTWQQNEVFGDLYRLYQISAMHNPNANAFLHNNMGNSLLASGHMQEAVKEFQEALRIDPNYALPHNNLGLALIKVGRVPEAVEQYREALRLQPNYPKALNNLGNALDLLNRTDEAIECYRQALKLDNHLPEVHFNLSLDLVKAGLPREAIAESEEALHLRPDYAKARAILAQAHAALGEFSEAIAEAQKAEDLARAQGQTALANQIQNMLDTYRNKLLGQ